MQFRNKPPQNGLATLETAGLVLVIGMFSYLGLGLLDYYGKTSQLRKVTDAVLAAHKSPVITQSVSLQGESTVFVLPEKAQAIVQDEVVMVEGMLAQVFRDAPLSRMDYRIEAEIRVAEIDPWSGACIGLQSVVFGASRGGLQLSREDEESFSLNRSFARLVEAKDAQCAIADPTPSGNYPGAVMRFLPVAAMNGVRIFVRQRHAPLTFFTVSGDEDASLIVDRKVLVLRGGIV